jgi:hypothetical protein
MQVLENAHSGEENPSFSFDFLWLGLAAFCRISLYFGVRLVKFTQDA